MRNCNASNRSYPVCPGTSVSDMGPDFTIAMAYVPWQQFGALYEPEKGLAIQQHLHKSYIERTRDAGYESEIRKQFLNYTDLQPTDILALYVNKCLFIYAAFLLDGNIYQVDVTADDTALSAILRQ